MLNNQVHDASRLHALIKDLGHPTEGLEVERKLMNDNTIGLWQCTLIEKRLATEALKQAEYAKSLMNLCDETPNVTDDLDDDDAEHYRGIVGRRLCLITKT